jgi:hypothetical protein
MRCALVLVVLLAITLQVQLRQCHGGRPFVAPGRPFEMSGFDHGVSITLRWQLEHTAGVSRCMSAVCFCVRPLYDWSSSTSVHLRGSVPQCAGGAAAAVAAAAVAAAAGR